MPTLGPERLEKIVGDALDVFYQRRLDSLNGLKLQSVLKRKNPYLFKALGYGTAHDIVDGLLKAHLSSSDEGIFGNVFFEKIALDIVGPESKSIADSVDIVVHKEGAIKAYAVKSGTAVFNSQSKARQNQAFEECRKRLSSMRKHFEAIVGYGYGKKRVGRTTKNNFKELAGQDFWEDLTGDSEFYLKLVRLMGDKPQQHLPMFSGAYSAALNRFVRDFITDFCFEDGRIDWEKLVVFNSGRGA